MIVSTSAGSGFRSATISAPTLALPQEIKRRCLELTVMMVTACGDEESGAEEPTNMAPPNSSPSRSISRY